MNTQAGVPPLDEVFLKALDLSQNLAPTPNNIERVASQTNPEAARAAFLQWELRGRAQVKFRDAARLFFTREALEQASGDAASAYHASLFPAGELVVDLTTGIGGDLLSLAKRGPAIGFELDPERRRFAQANLAALGLTGEVECADGLAWLEARSDSYFFADPSRRVAGERVRAPDLYRPDPTHLAKLCGRQRLGVIKLSPLLDDSFLESLAPQVEFVSVEGECKEALVIGGSQSERGKFAVLILPQGNLKLSSCSIPASTETPSTFLYECDPAAIRAHAYGALCLELSLSPLGDSKGYLTGSNLQFSPWIKAYRVLDPGSGDLRTIKRKLLALNSGTPILKQRQTGLDLEKLRGTLKIGGKRPLVVICYPIGRSVRYVITEPIPVDMRANI